MGALVNRYIMGIDPGADADRTTKERTRGTGWSVVHVPEQGFPRRVAGGVILGGPDDFLRAVRGAGDDPAFGGHLMGATELVVENFTKQVSAAKIHPLEIIGMVRMFCAMRVLPLTINMPGARKLVSHDDLKEKGWWPGGAGHADEAQALRHVLSKLLREPHVPTAMLFHPPDEDA